MPKALQEYLSASCCYITVDYPGATTNSNAGLFFFLADTTTAALFMPHMCSQLQQPVLHNTARVILEKCWANGNEFLNEILS